jgi:hypothetical protein
MSPPENGNQGGQGAPDSGKLTVATPETFRLPSTALFLGLIPIFSGQARRRDLAQSLVDDGRPKLDDTGRLRPTQVQTYIVYSGKESEARTSVSLFQDDPLWREGELSALIRRQFGPSGLKHLLGLFCAAEERGAGSGGFIFDINRHLDILGYKRSNRVLGRAYHTARRLSEAREIVALLCSLTIVQEVRAGTRRGQTYKVRLLLDEASQESWEETVESSEQIRARFTTNERIYLRINPHLFTLAIEGTREQALSYTHQLKKLARENAQTQALTLALGVHLPIKFRLNGCQPVRYGARHFLRMAGLTDEGRSAYDKLERVEKSLRYMVEQGYLSGFETERFRYETPPEAGAASSPPAEAPPPARPRPRLQQKAGGLREGLDPLEEAWQVEAPLFLRQMLAQTLARRAAHQLAAAPPGGPGLDRGLRRAEAETGGEALPSPPPPRPSFEPALPGVEPGGAPPTAAELLRQVRVKLGLSQKQLARRLSITQAAVSMAEAGRRPRMAARLLAETRRLRPD